MNKGHFFPDRKSFKAQTSFQMKNFFQAAEYQDTKCKWGLSIYQRYFSSDCVQSKVHSHWKRSVALCWTMNKAQWLQRDRCSPYFGCSDLMLQNRSQWVELLTGRLNWQFIWRSYRVKYKSPLKITTLIPHPSLTITYILLSGNHKSPIITNQSLWCFSRWQIEMTSKEV